jgi:hypothetical protein
MMRKEETIADRDNMFDFPRNFFLTNCRIHTFAQPVDCQRPIYISKADIDQQIFDLMKQS